MTDEKREDFDRLLSRLDPDRSQAGEKYLEIWRMLARYFECNHCSDPDELANEALSRVAKRLRTEPIGNICGYAHGVAKWMRLEDVRRVAGQVPIEEIPGGPDTLEDKVDPEREILDRIDNEILMACLQDCLEKLSEDDRRLSVAFYSAEEGMQIQLRRRLAKEAGRTMGALWTHMNRLRAKLESCVLNCLANRQGKIGAAWDRQYPWQL